MPVHMKPRCRTKIHCYMPLPTTGCIGLGCDKPKGHLGLCLSEGVGNKRVSRSVEHFIAAAACRGQREEQADHNKPKKRKVTTTKTNRERPVYTVDRILDHRPCTKDNNHQKFQYLVKWKSYGAIHNSWEPETSFLHKSVLDMYWAGESIV